MEMQLIVEIREGQVLLTGPLHDPQLCLQLLFEGHKALVNMVAQQAAQNFAAKKSVLMPDGRPMISLPERIDGDLNGNIP